MSLLRHFRDKVGLTGAELAELAGTSQAQISRLEKGKSRKGRALTKEWAELLAPHLGIKPAQLLFDPDELRPESFDPDAIEPDHAFDAEDHEPIDPDAPPTIPPNGIVEVDARAGMGGGGQVAHAYYRDGDKIETRDAVKPDPWVFPPWFLRDIGAKPGDLLIIEAKGDSMRPTIRPGTPLIIDTRHRIPSPDGIYAIRDRWGDIQAKRIETSKIIGDSTIRIISDNGGHVEEARSEDQLMIVGKVVAGWHFF